MEVERGVTLPDADAARDRGGSPANLGAGAGPRHQPAVSRLSTERRSIRLVVTERTLNDGEHTGLGWIDFVDEQPQPTITVSIAAARRLLESARGGETRSDAATARVATVSAACARPAGRPRGRTLPVRSRETTRPRPDAGVVHRQRNHGDAASHTGSSRSNPPVVARLARQDGADGGSPDTADATERQARQSFGRAAARTGRAQFGVSSRPASLSPGSSGSAESPP